MSDTTSTVEDNLNICQDCPNSKVRLFIELHERIIGFVWHHGTLASCARVCKAWLPFSRHALYYEFILDTPMRLYMIHHLVSDPPPAVKPYLDHVKSLIIPPRSPQNDNRILQGRLVILRLPGLEKLVFNSVDWRMPWFGSLILYGPATYFRSVTRLELFNTIFVHIVQLHILVCEFPALSSLVLSDIKLFQVIPIPPPEAWKKAKACPSLETLHLQQVQAGDIVKWLVASGVGQMVSTLTWNPFRRNDGTDQALGLLLQGIGKSLESVELDIFSHKPIKNLAFCSNLKFLEIDYCECPILLDEPDLMKEILSGLSTCNLEKCNLYFEAKSYKSDSGQWICDLRALQDFDDILSRPQFNRLLSVEMTVCVTLTDWRPDLAVLDLQFLTQTSKSSNIGASTLPVNLEVTGPVDEEMRAAQRGVVNERLQAAVKEVFGKCYSRGILEEDVNIWLQRWSDLD